MSGRYLSSDFSLPCPPGLDIPEEQHRTITANTLKVSCPQAARPVGALSSAEGPGRAGPHRADPPGAPGQVHPVPLGCLRASFLTGFPPPQTLLLLGCFAVFWTFYYMLEVCLSRNNVGLDLACSGSTACQWYQGGKHRALESGLEMESVPLYREKDTEDVEIECEHPEPAQEDEGNDEGSWTPTHPKLPSGGRAASLQETALARAGYPGREATAELLTEDREHRAC